MILSQFHQIYVTYVTAMANREGGKPTYFFILFLILITLTYIIAFYFKYAFSNFSKKVEYLKKYAGKHLKLYKFSRYIYKDKINWKRFRMMG